MITQSRTLADLYPDIYTVLFNELISVQSPLRKRVDTPPSPLDVDVRSPLSVAHQEEIEKLKDQLAEAHLGASITHVTGDNDGMPDVDAENEIADTALTVQEPDMATADAGVSTYGQV